MYGTRDVVIYGTVDTPEEEPEPTAAPTPAPTAVPVTGGEPEDVLTRLD